VLAGVGTALGAAALAGCTTGNDSTDGSDDSGATGDSSSDSDDGPDGNDSRDTDGSDGPGESGESDDGDSDDGSSDDDNGSSDDGSSDDDNGSSDDDGDSDDGSDDGSSDDGDSGDESGCAGESVHEGYEETGVTITSSESEQLGSVTAAIADTDETRQTGLSETGCLPPDRGMLFVYENSQRLNFWMINMDFGLDIVHIDSEGVITSIQHAEAPAEDESGTEEHHQYPGNGQFVLEVNYGWTTERDVEAGDVVNFEL
jgi:uncharacterized membrane protein (UPF0127 family)